MDINYLGMLWQRDDGGDRFSISANELQSLVREQGQRFESRLRFRDWLEAGLGVLLGCFFILFAVFFERLDDEVLSFQWDWILLGLGCFFVSGVFTHQRLQSKQFEDAHGDTLIESLSKHQASLAAQIGFLKYKIWWMYVLPIAAPLYLTVCKSFPSDVKVNYSLTCAALFVGIVVLNYWYASARLEPKLNEINKMIREVTE